MTRLHSWEMPMGQKDALNIIPVERIQQCIYMIRGERVLLDKDLAVLYGVETKVLNQAVKRNIDRFPEDFMFQLSYEEAESLRSQIVTSNEGRGGRRYMPYVFTEQGVAMSGRETILSRRPKSQFAGPANISVD